MSLKYEPSSEPLHICAKQLCLQVFNDPAYDGLLCVMRVSSSVAPAEEETADTSGSLPEITTRNRYLKPLPEINTRNPKPGEIQHGLQTFRKIQNFALKPDTLNPGHGSLESKPEPLAESQPKPCAETLTQL